MRVYKWPFIFQFEKKRKTNFMYLNHSFSQIKMKIKNEIEVTVSNFFRS